MYSLTCTSISSGTLTSAPQLSPTSFLQLFISVMAVALSISQSITSSIIFVTVTFS
jgi:hypothetical protein